LYQQKQPASSKREPPRAAEKFLPAGWTVPAAFDAYTGEYKRSAAKARALTERRKKMALWIVLSLMLVVGSALGAGGNFGDTPGLNGSGTQTQNAKGINPVQHSE
jgi:hypothetical protein